MKPMDETAESSIPTNRLRIKAADATGYSIIQQAWENLRTGQIEWRGLPLVEADAPDIEVAEDV